MKRIKRRYLALQVDSDGAISQREFMDAVWGAVTKLYGECGASLAGLSLIDYDAETKMAVIRVALTAVDLVRASLASITFLGGREVTVHVVTVSGTIKALRERFR